MRLAIHLYQVRVRMVGFNQIRTVHMGGSPTHHEHWGDADNNFNNAIEYYGLENA